MTPLEELLQMLRFGAVGLLATVVHFLVALGVGKMLGLSSILVMNIAGFLVALVISFLGHYHFTFSSSELYSRAFLKFFAVALLCLLASSLCIAMAGYALLPNIIQLFIGAVVIPIISYIANKRIVF